MQISDNGFDTPPPASALLREQIRKDGPISFRDWMAVALYHPTVGYYCRSDRVRWGRAGDYRTSPERSPLFAATFARYFAGLFEPSGSPECLTIAEFGAGDGSFAEGVLEALERRFPAVFAATRYVVDDISPDSLAAARGKLVRFGARVEFGGFEQREPIEAGIVFSNELLDAFPVHRVTMHKNELKELYVGLDEAGEFAWITGELSTNRLRDYFELVGGKLIEHQIAEVNLAIDDWLRRVSAKLHSGFLVTADYGADTAELYGPPERRKGTLRAFHRHQLAPNVLARPGEQDITTNVDWSFVRAVGNELGFETVGFERQDRFLLKAGLPEELERLESDAEDEVRKLQLRTDAREMILPNGMAASFQVLTQRKLAQPG